jgi:hypothetical protein
VWQRGQGPELVELIEAGPGHFVAREN